MAGSILILLKNNGNEVPINVATIILHNNENETMHENMNSWCVINKLKNNNISAKIIPIPVPIIISLKIILKLFFL